MAKTTDTESLSTRLINQLPPSITLGLATPYLDLLEKLGRPQDHLPSVFHVAGTNGKGSTCAFLRSILEAAGHRVHVYTSPHLVRYHERFRVAGDLIEEAYLVELLEECRALMAPGTVSVFEVLTAVALAAFARTKADFTILEVGLGGRLDATNVVDHPLATLITRLSYDHQHHLGTTLAAIATEKAGIMREHVPCFVAPQPAAEVRKTLRTLADQRHVPLVMGGDDWSVAKDLAGDGFVYTYAGRRFDLPRPSLLGDHQLWNAGLAIAALTTVPSLTSDAMARGLQTASWPARLQRLTKGAYADLIGPTAELWLDGGHNDSAGEVLAQQAKAWRDEDGLRPRPLHVICGMLTTKTPADFLRPLAPFATTVQTVTIDDEKLSFSADDLAQSLQTIGLRSVAAAPHIAAALERLGGDPPSRARVLICGSLYLAGHVLRANAS